MMRNITRQCQSLRLHLFWLSMIPSGQQCMTLVFIAGMWKVFEANHGTISLSMEPVLKPFDSIWYWTIGSMNWNSQSCSDCVNSIIGLVIFLFNSICHLILFSRFFFFFAQPSNWHKGALKNMFYYSTTKSKSTGVTGLLIAFASLPFWLHLPSLLI